MQAERINKIIRVYAEQNNGPYPSDVLGSYTGMTRDGERPVQDADDL